ncbi:MAG TPA: dihydroneopterin aldolase [Anaerolineales bacterium]|nr:dihydroneopterin aldolase [Anaerolineales bacterium]
MSQDRIEVKDLLLRGVIGVNDWEREQAQDILINITLFADLSRAGSSDGLDDTVNYRSVTKKIIQHVETSQRFTVEALASDIARICLQEHRVEKVRVRLEKPGALRFARSVGVEIERRAEDFA